MKIEARSDVGLEKADEKAVIEHFLHGAPIDPEVSARVHVRAQAITAACAPTMASSMRIRSSHY